MGYMDIWIYNSRPRMKVFLCYLLIFIAFFVFSDIMIYCYTKSMYQPMENCEIQISAPEVTVKEAIASNANGSVKGTIKNTTNEDLTNKYLKFEFYTERDFKAGTKYVRIDSVKPGKQKDYEVGFKFDNISSVKISMVDKEEITNATEKELKEEKAYGPSGLLAGIILGYFFL